MSISAYPVHQLLPSNAVCGFLTQQLPEFEVVMCVYINVALRQICQQCIVETKFRSAASVCSAFRSKHQHLQNSVFTVKSVIRQPQSVTSKSQRRSFHTQSILSFLIRQMVIVGQVQNPFRQTQQEGVKTTAVTTTKRTMLQAVKKRRKHCYVYKVPLQSCIDCTSAKYTIVQSLDNRLSAADTVLYIRKSFAIFCETAAQVNNSLSRKHMISQIDFRKTVPVKTAQSMEADQLALIW